MGMSTSRKFLAKQEDGGHEGVERVVTDQQRMPGNGRPTIGV